MRIVVASDSFKGTLSSVEIARLVAEEAPGVIPGAEVDAVPMADGGEGTAGVLASACGGKIREVDALDPLGRPVRASYALLGSGRAAVEVAAASGLPLLAPEERHAGRTTSFGTGQLILDALDQGCDSITLALGGSATNDCGTGILRSLGARFLSVEGEELEGTGDELGRISRIDLSGLDERVGRTEFHVMCDVDNPLTGPDGAAAVYGPQKGAGPKDVARLDAGMHRYAAVIRDQLGIDVENVPGSGAAGGIGACCVAFFGAPLVPGVERVASLVGLEGRLADADLCITGEGRLDAQSIRGKVVAGVARACARAGVPCVAITGSLDLGAPELPGLAAVVPTAVDPDLGLAHSLEHAEELYRLAVRRALGLVFLGASLRA